MRKEYDLRSLKKRPGKPKVDPNATKVPISLRLDAADLASLKEEAERQGIPYQTLLGSILRRYLNADLIDARTVNAIKKKLASG